MSEGSKSNRIAVQSRDLDLLQGLFECRVMTLRQAAILHFDGKAEACKKRLQLLKRVGLVIDCPRGLRAPAVVTLGRRGFQLLEAERRLAEVAPTTWTQTARRLRVSPLTILHELEVLELRTAFVAAVRKCTCVAVVSLTTWPQQIAFDAFKSDGQRRPLRPDGFVTLSDGRVAGGQRDSHFFWEIDRSTESLLELVERAHCYQEFYRRGGLAERLGHPVSEFKMHPFRVLVTCRTAERRNNLAERLLATRPKVGALIWITTIAEAVSEPFGPIWITSGDYDAAVSGTQYGSTLNVQGASRLNYRRNGERDSYVEHHITKRRLLRE